jgi:hypothetical protein
VATLWTHQCTKPQTLIPNHRQYVDAGTWTLVLRYALAGHVHNAQPYTIHSRAPRVTLGGVASVQTRARRRLVRPHR